MVTHAEDGRDATYVRVSPKLSHCQLCSPHTHVLSHKYELAVDRNARYRNRPTDFVLKTFWGQLRQILVVDINPIPSATPPEMDAQTLLLAVIHTCTIENSHNALDIHYYKNHGRKEVVDLDTIQCCVGQVKDRGRFAIVDRSGPLARAVFTEDRE